MNRIAVGRNGPCARIPALYLGNSLTLGHPRLNSKIKPVAARVRSVARRRKTLGYKRPLMRWRAISAGRGESELFQRGDRVESTTETRR